MGTLRELVSEPTKRKQLLEEAQKTVDKEVSDKGGLGGMAIKAAYAMAKGVAPGIMPKILDNLADDFMDALQPFYDEAKQKSVELKELLANRGAEAANALLAITDARAAKEEGGTLKKGYEKLRPTAQKHVELAIPRLAELITKIAS
ncbi:MAG: hypothetical protein JWN04_5108 [Myxococcaceae bacterium]|nr:hypothetical protein [Myxococcaceae bacterium]